jgi:hypothetical protein
VWTEEDEKKKEKMVVGSLGLFISLEPLGGRRRRGQERGGFGGVAPNGKGKGGRGGRGRVWVAEESGELDFFSFARVWVFYLSKIGPFRSSNRHD